MEPNATAEQFGMYGAPIQAKKGDVYPAIGETAGWYKIRYGNVNDVWLSKTTSKKFATPFPTTVFGQVWANFQEMCEIQYGIYQLKGNGTNGWLMAVQSSVDENSYIIDDKTPQTEIRYEVKLGKQVGNAVVFPYCLSVNMIKVPQDGISVTKSGNDYPTIHYGPSNTTSEGTFNPENMSVDKILDLFSNYVFGEEEGRIDIYTAKDFTEVMPLAYDDKECRIVISKPDRKQYYLCKRVLRRYGDYNAFNLYGPVKESKVNGRYSTNTYAFDINGRWTTFNGTPLSKFYKEVKWNKYTKFLESAYYDMPETDGSFLETWKWGGFHYMLDYEFSGTEQMNIHYNYAGRKVVSQSISSSEMGDVENTETFIKYTYSHDSYDEWGNWIKRTAKQDKEQWIETREIIYHFPYMQVPSDYFDKYKR